MPYWTQGVVTFRASTPKTILITPNTDYQVIHDGKKYTIFVQEPVNNVSKNYEVTDVFQILDKSLEPLLIQAAFSNVRLQIAIDDYKRITDLVIPAKS